MAYKKVHIILNLIIIVLILGILIWSGEGYENHILVSRNNGYILSISNHDDAYEIALNKEDERIFKEKITIPMSNNDDRYGFNVMWYDDKVNVTYNNAENGYTYDKDILFHNSKSE